MLEVIQDHVWSVIRPGAPPHEMQAAVDALTVTNPAYWQAKKRGWHSVDKKISLFKGSLFHTGLLPRLTKALKKQKIELQIVKTSVKPIPMQRLPHPQMFDGIELNEEQFRCLSAMVEADRGYLSAHPGFGKTEIIFAIYECFRPCSALFIVTRAGLKEQAFKRCVKRLGEEPYVIGQSKGPIPKQGLIIATYHTLYLRLFGQPAGKKAAIPVDQAVVKAMKGVDLFMGDEIHRGPGKRYAACLEFLEADRRYGFSATPLSSKDALRNMILRGLVGEQIVKANRKKQLAAKRIPKTYVLTRTLGASDTSMFATPLSYQDAFTRAYLWHRPFLKAVLKDVRDSYEAGLPCLVQVDWHEPGELLYKLLQKYIPAEHVDFLTGKVPAPKREPRKEAFIAGETKVMVATPIFSEGEDLPNIASIVLACPGRDPNVLYQRAGRGFRPKDHLFMFIYWNLRHRYFKGHCKAQKNYFERNKDLYVLLEEARLETARQEALNAS